MSKEMIMKILNNYTKGNKDTSKEMLVEAIQGLLDLYNKEKAKNKDLSNNYDILYKDYEAVKKFVKEESIPRAVLEAKIEELKEKSGGNVFHIQQTINSNIRLLQEILTKGEK